MNIAYVDTSCIVAVALEEDEGVRAAASLDAYEILVSSNLMEAELRSVLAREEVDAPPTELLSRIAWLHPDRPLTAEYLVALRAGYLRGADLWHVACALYLRVDLPGLRFVSLDHRQQAAAVALGFPS